ncbi:MAG TPA: TonB-dependent receptor [Opitutaceae bacterium]|nr:TonB-dependent receptor [Opitutaceae bacterium]
MITTAVLPVAHAQATSDQTAAPAPATTAVPTSQQVETSAAQPAASNNVYKMSPFEVQTSDKDVGYYTQNTLSGSRLNTKLSDIGASITVITKQQMQDTSAIDLNDMFLYEASTEGTENYTALGGFGKGTGIGDTIQGSPQTSNRVRGLGPVDITRNFFLTNSAIQLDSYNVDRVDVSRGPNSTLYGIGSPSGIVNSTIEQAVLNKDTNEIQLRYGSFGDERAVINLNRALIPDKLAIAVAGLYQNTHRTGQEPVYDIQRREFATFTLKPLPKTTIRANMEYYDNPNRRANSVTPVDEITPWLNAGRPTWDPITFTANVNGTTTAPITNNQLLPAGLSVGLGNWGDGQPQMYFVHGQLQLWEQAQLGTNFAAPGTPTNAVGSVNGTGVNATTNVWGPIGFERLATSQGNYAKFAGSAPAGQVTYPLFHEAGLTNKQLMNYNSINTLSGNLGEDKAQIYNVDVEQQVTDDLSFEFGWYREQFDSQAHNYFGGNVGNALQVDPNTRLLNGAPNPYFGRPFIAMQQGDDIYTHNVNEQMRIQGTYQLDFTHNDNWTKWLGRHSALAFYQHQDITTQSYRYRLQVLDSHSWNTTTDIGNNASGPSGSNSQRFYLSNSGTAVSFDPGFFTNTNFTYPMTWYNTALNGGTWTQENVKAGPAIFPTSTVKNQGQIWSYAGGLQDYFWNDRLVITLGQRHDYQRSRNTLNPTINPSTGLTDLYNLTQFTSWVGTSGITRQAGAVLHVTKWLALHYNQSQNFQVTSLGMDPFGNVLPNPSGHGKDYGVLISLWDDKLVAEMNWYKADAENSRAGIGAFLDRAERIDYSFFIPWAQEVATNALGPSASAAAINSYAQTNVLKFSTGLQNFVNATQHQADTQTVAATGYEVNITYNPTRNWTMKFTADQDKAVNSAVLPNTQKYIAARLGVWATATDPVLGPFWTTISPGNLSTGLGQQTPQQWLNGTVDAAGLDVLLAQQGHISPDLPEYQLNYLTNYLFVTGPLRNFGIGGALRYQTPAAIGYHGAAPDPAALGAIDQLQAFNPINSKELIHQDMWISYTTRLPWLDNKIRVKLQLNIRDMWSNGYLQVVQVNPDGSPQGYRIIPPRQFYFTTTFDF